jgi:hypothetical protein
MFQAQPGKEDQVREALHALSGAAGTMDPPSKHYTILESQQKPGHFLIFDEQEDGTGAVSDLENEELMKLGTALREALLEPLSLIEYRVLDQQKRAA